MLDVLIVDDDPNVRECLARALNEAGHRVEQAGDGTKAIDLVHRCVFDLAIVDVHMPTMGGLTLLRRLRRFAPETDVVLMTSFSNVLDAVTGLRDGAVDYLVKPFEPDALVERVETFMMQRRWVARPHRLDGTG
jgi:DNA-binding response OmpR family regulator